MANSLGFSQDSNGDLYELFSDGTRVLVEAGYAKRISDLVASSQKTNATVTTPATPAITSAGATNYTTSTASNPPIKTATPDIVLFDDDSVPIEVMSDLIFEDIGGQELINIARTDTVNGQNVSYQLIKNLTSIQQQYNPNNILSLQGTSDKIFAGYSIKLDKKLPAVGNGTNGSNIYIDSTTGDLIIEVVDTAADEQVEVQILTNGTIYEVNT